MTLPAAALPKSWSLVSMVPCVSIVPSRKKSPSNSFFLVSMLSTGRPALRYFFLRRAMFSNWALRFGSRGPIVFFFNAFRRRYRCLRSNCETTCRLAEVPNSPSLSAICRRDRFVHFTSARIGSPAVWSWRTFRKFSSRAGETSISRLRPPPFLSDTSRIQVVPLDELVTPEANGLGIAPQDAGDVLDASVPQLGRFDGGISPSIALLQGVEETLHQAFDFRCIRGHDALLD